MPTLNKKQLQAVNKSRRTGGSQSFKNKIVKMGDTLAFSWSVRE